MNRSLSLAMAALLGLAGCGAAVTSASTSMLDVPELAVASDGRCYGIVQTPAVIETVTEQVVVQPAILDADGGLRSPAIYRTVTRQEIVTERRETEFESICRHQLTSDFIASLQRALQVRGAYSGPVTGILDPRTTRAQRRFQVSQGGPDSNALAIDTARQLGLVAYPEAELRAE